MYNACIENVTGCSRADLIIHHIKYWCKKDLEECIRACSIQELVLVIDRPSVVRFFIGHYNDVTRTIFFEVAKAVPQGALIHWSGMSERNYDFVYLYLSEVMNASNEDILYEQCDIPNTHVRRNMVYKYGTTALLDKIDFKIESVSTAVECALAVSDERLFFITDWMVSKKISIYEVYKRVVMNFRERSNEKSTIDRLETYRQHYNLDNKELIKYAGVSDIRDRLRELYGV